MRQKKLEQLQDDELFALTAIIIHEDLTVDELHTVLNMPQASVRALCRGLEQRTLISETESGRYKVRFNWLPAGGTTPATPQFFAQGVIHEFTHQSP